MPPPRSEDAEGLTKIVTALIAIGGLQRDQLPDAVGVPEQRVVIRRRDRRPASRSRISARADAKYHRRRRSSDAGRIVHNKANSRMTAVIARKLRYR